METRSVLKAAVVGLGFIGSAHVETLHRLPFAEVTAVVDSNFPQAQKTAAQWGIPHAYSDYMDAVRSPEVDIIHVAATNNMHYPIAKAALEAGKHVICEKPLACSGAEAETLVRLAADSGRAAAVSYNLRFYPLVQQMRGMVQSGQHGRVLSCHGSYLQDWLLYETDYSWRVDPAISGPARAVADIGTHWMDMAEYVTGAKIVSVCADTAVFHPVRKRAKGGTLTFQTADKDAEYESIPVFTEDYAAILMRFSNGGMGNLVISQTAAGRKNSLSIEIDCEQTALSFCGERPNELWIGHRETPNELMIKDPALMEPAAARLAGFPGGHAEGFPDTMKQSFSQVYRYILDGSLQAGQAPSFPTFLDGRHTLALCDAILKSAKSRQWVNV